MPIYKFEHGFYSELERLPSLGYVWRNAEGGCYDFKPSHFKSTTAVFYKAVSFREFEVEDRARTILQNVLLNNLTHGWIDLQGRFYSCGMDKHTALAEVICGDWNEVEDKNWTKIGYDYWRHGKWSPHARLTNAQKRTLSQIGRSADDDTYKDASIKFEDVFPTGNRAMNALIAKYEAIVEREQSKRKPITPSLEMI